MCLSEMLREVSVEGVLKKKKDGGYLVSAFIRVCRCSQRSSSKSRHVYNKVIVERWRVL